MHTKPLKATLTASLAVLILTIGSAHADDTDVYMNPGAGLPPGSEPMVMFSLDYRPNLAATACQNGECDALIKEGYMPLQASYTFFDVLRGVMRKVFGPLEGVRVGLMLNRCSNGGYIAMGFEAFEAGDANGAKARFHKILASLPTPLGGQSHSYQGKELFFEFFRYLTGQGVYNAHNGYTDYFTSNADNLDVDNPAIAWDAAIESGPKNRRFPNRFGRRLLEDLLGQHDVPGHEPGRRLRHRDREPGRVRWLRLAAK
jgi:type IV pilus assembly protein PilY1